MKSFLASLFATVVICLSAPASAVIVCELSSPNSSMPPQFVIARDGNAPSAIVGHAWTDGIHQHNVALQDNGSRWNFSFQLQGRISNRTTTFTFSMAYFPGQRRLSGSIQGGNGFTGSIRGQYACVDT